MDIETFDYKTSEGVESFKVRVINSPAGCQKIDEVEEVKLSEELRTRFRLLEKRDLDKEQIKDLGRHLSDLLFPPKVRDLFKNSYSMLKSDEGLRVRLRLNDNQIGDVPWEYVCFNNDDFLVLNHRISLVRYELLKEPEGSMTPLSSDFIRVAVLLSSPQDPTYPDLDLNTELEYLKKAFKDERVIVPEYYENATTETLQEILTKDNLHVFHFSGHGKYQRIFGKNQGYIILVDKDQKPVLFPADKLALNLKGRNIRLAFLGSCNSGRRDQINPWNGVAPALTKAGIPAVLAMQYSIRDGNAINFSKRFYQSLVKGVDIDTAVADGRMAIFNTAADDKERDWGVPVLYLRSHGGVLFPKDKIPTNRPSSENVDKILNARVLDLKMNIEQVSANAHNIFEKFPDLLDACPLFSNNSEILSSSLAGSLSEEMGRLKKDITGLSNQGVDNWEIYNNAYSKSHKLFNQWVELIGGMAIRKENLDDKICAIADDIIHLCKVSTSKDWSGLVIPSDKSEIKHSLIRIIRLRFKDWTIWTLPLNAHEYGHIWLNGPHETNTALPKFIEDMTIELNNLDTRFKPLLVNTNKSIPEKEIVEKAKNYLLELMADTFATYLMGPSYACSAIMLHLNPNISKHGSSSPSGPERASIILGTLEKMNNVDLIKPYEDLHQKLKEGWDIALQFANPHNNVTIPDYLPLLGDSIYSFYDDVLGLKYNKYPKSSDSLKTVQSLIYDWKIDLKNQKSKLSTNAENMQIIDVLNAGWMCRIDYPSINDSDVKKIEIATKEMCSNILKNRPVSKGKNLSNQNSPLSGQDNMEDAQ